tara:strand:+ start:1465 stop:2214 length:750 start_codon:yes stop_codon:yes gene_type:complete
MSSFPSSGTLRFSTGSGNARSINTRFGFTSTQANSSLDSRHDNLSSWASKPNWTSGNPSKVSEFYSAVQTVGGCCILEGSNITLWTGETKKVEDIKVGDELLAYQIRNMDHNAEENQEFVDFNETTLEASLKTRTTVVDIAVSKNPNLVEINEKLTMTDFDIVLVFKPNGDPFGRHEGKNLWLWLPAQAVEVGDKVVGKNFQHIEVTSVIHRRNINRLSTYAIDCEAYDWFYANGILVHNKGGCPTPGR